MLSKLRVFGIFTVGFAALLASVPAHAAGSKLMRRYYLTIGTFDGSHAPTACASDFHMASLWEIAVTSDLVYYTTLGLTSADSGSGPPAVIAGWIRTGTIPSFTPASSAHPGLFANCNAYTTNDSFYAGTVIGLPGVWDLPPANPAIAPWGAAVQTCDQLRPVWCVEN